VLDYLLQYGLFLAEVTTVVIAIGVVIRFLFNAIRRAREYTAEHLEVHRATPIARRLFIMRRPKILNILTSSLSIAPA
jgi:hypothetical protein